LRADHLPKASPASRSAGSSQTGVSEVKAGLHSWHVACSGQETALPTIPCWGRRSPKRQSPQIRRKNCQVQNLRSETIPRSARLPRLNCVCLNFVARRFANDRMADLGTHGPVGGIAAAARFWHSRLRRPKKIGKFPSRSRPNRHSHLQSRCTHALTHALLGQHNQVVSKHPQAHRPLKMLKSSIKTPSMPKRPF
jgi:hypothetical protein